jgi:very-short-patch-repair endonuclease
MTKKQSDAAKLRFADPRNRKQMSFSVKCGMANLETRARMRDSKLGKKNPMYRGHFSIEHRLKMHNSHLGKHHSDKTLEKMSIIKRGANNPLYGTHPTAETLAKLSNASKALWQNPEYAQKLINAFHNSPTSPEILIGTLLHDLCLDEFAYNGCGPIVIGGKIPDFVHNDGRKLAINVNGDYFHKDEDVHKIRSHYAKYGYSLLVIWEHEIYSDWDKVIGKINNFVG